MATLEVWRPIRGYDGIYEISTFGRVRSYKKGKWGFNETPKIIVGQRGTHYRTVSLNGKSFNVHRLVAMTFIENPLNLREVNHIDGNKLNNCVNNLEWVSHQDNMNHANLTGLATFKRKAIICVETNTAFNSITAASKETKISRRSISNCLNGYSKTAGGYHWKFERRM